MGNITYTDAYVKLQYRLNKSGTEDYGNIDHDPATEAINKALNDWVRRQYHGANQFKEGAEESRQRVDDLQVLLKNRDLSLETGTIYSDSATLPSDYRYFNRFSFFDTTNSCGTDLLIFCELVEEANVDILLNTEDTKPSLKFEQAFHTIINNKIRLYHDGQFSPSVGTLTYYRAPKLYDSTTDDVFDFKDDIVELIIDEASKIIAGDMDNIPAYQRTQSSVEGNN